MKHIEKFKSFNETLFPTEMDGLIKNILKRVKEVPFDITNYSSDTEEYGETITYRLEESDSDLGYVEIKIYRDTDNAFPFYNIYLDNSEIECSLAVKMKLYRYLKRCYKNNEKEEQRQRNAELKSKYKAFESNTMKHKTFNEGI